MSMRDVVVEWNGERIAIGAVEVHEHREDQLITAMMEFPSALARFGPVERSTDGVVTKMPRPVRWLTVARALSEAVRGASARDQVFEDAIISRALDHYGVVALARL